MCDTCEYPELTTERVKA